MPEPRTADVPSARTQTGTADVPSARTQTGTADVPSARTQTGTADVPSATLPSADTQCAGIPNASSRITGTDRMSPPEAAGYSLPSGKADETSALPEADETSALPDEICAVPAPRGWHYRGYLPHFDDQETPQFITFRLADSMPQKILEAWKRELKLTSQTQGPQTDATARALQQMRTRIEKYLDLGHGSCVLRKPEFAALVQNSLRHFDEQRYRLFSWVIMPNHVHVLCRQVPGNEMSSIVKSWKSFTAHAINRALSRTGSFWQEDYFDRYIRDQNHFLSVVQYIERNPVTAGLCKSPEDWAWSSAALIGKRSPVVAPGTADVPSATLSINAADVPSATLSINAADVPSATLSINAADVPSARDPLEFDHG